MGVMQKDAVTWPAIRDWLKRNPQQARDVMRTNERYIFFKDTKSQSASGSEGVPLTAQSTLTPHVTLTPFRTPICIHTLPPVARTPRPAAPSRPLPITPHLRPPLH